MVCPEWAIDEMHILYGHILTVGDVNQSWAHSLEVGALSVVLSSYPELLPVVAPMPRFGTLIIRLTAISSAGLLMVFK